MQATGVSEPTPRQDVWIIVPAYNEGPVVGRVVSELLTVYPNVVVVDDGSEDDTLERVRETEATVIRHVVNLGQGAALRTGIDYALSQGAPTLVTFDADGQHRVGDIEVLLTALAESGADIALGSRFLGPEEGRNIPAGRRVLLKAAILFTRIVSGIRLTDAHNGLRAMRADAARKLPIRQARMAHASEILHGIVEHDLRHVEVPVTISYTARSRLKGQVSLDALNVVFDLAIRRLLR
jgi:glycosyltransferase involved in cell wall biosynthesis